MTDSTQASGAQDTTAATQAEGGQSEGSVLTPETTTQPDQQGQQQEAAKPEGEQGGGKDKAGQDDQGKPEAPAEYADFSLPEGVEMDAEVLTEFKGIAKELGISQEAAQKLIDLQGRLETQRADAIQQALADQSKQWAEQIRSDKDFGGENYDSNVAVAVKAIEQFGSPELRQVLNDSGLGNHPELVKFCHRIGKAISDDSLVLGGTQGKDEMTIVDAFK